MDKAQAVAPGTVREYGTIGDGPRSERTILQSIAGPYGRTYRLEHLSEGWTPAGSMARYQGEAWSVGFLESSGVRHGRLYRTLAEATAAWSQVRP